MPTGLNNNQQAKFLQIIADPLDEARLLSDLFQFLSSEFGEMYFSLWLRDISKRKEYALLVGEYGYKTRGVIKDFKRIPIGVGVVGRTLESGEALLYDMRKESHANIPADQEFVREERLRSILCVAAFTGTEVTGALLAAKRDTNKWSKSEITSLSYICNEAIFALTRASRRSENQLLVQMLLQSHISIEVVAVLEQIASLLRDGFRSDLCTITIRPRKGTTLLSHHSSGAGKEHAIASGTEFAVAKGIMALGRSLRLFNASDKDELADYGIHLPKVTDVEGSSSGPISGHVLGSPIILGTVDTDQIKPVGAIILIRSIEKTAFLPQNEGAISAIGRYLGLLLERTQALQGMKDYIESFRQLSSSLIIDDIHSMLRGLLMGLASLSESLTGYVALSSGNAHNMVETITTIGNVPDHYQGDRALSQIESQAIISGSSLFLPTRQHRKRLEPMLTDNYESQLCIPIKKGSQVLGLLGLFSQYDHALASREVHFAEASCGLAAVAIDNLNKRTLTKERHLKLLEILARLNSTKDLTQTYESLASGVAELLEGEFSYIAIAEGSKYRVVSSTGISKDECNGLYFPSNLVPLKQLFSNNNVIVVENTGIDTDFAVLIPDQEPRSCILGPIVEEDRRIGFVVVSAAIGKYDVSDVNSMEILSLLCHYATAAISMSNMRDEQDRVQRSLREQQSAILAGTLSLGISHQISKYLQRLSLSLENIKGLFDSLEIGDKLRKSGKDEIKSFVDSNMMNVQELDDLNQNMLRVGSITTKKEAVNFNYVVQGYIDCLVKKMKESKITWDFTPDASLGPKNQPKGTVIVDPGQVGQVVTILIDNAIDSYLGKVGRIEISTKRFTLNEDDYATIIVRDYGVGISDKDKPHVGKQFFSTKPGGHGFGLPMAKLITERHSGKLDFVSEEWKGSEFLAYFLIG